jgi:hypothetical protein
MTALPALTDGNDKGSPWYRSVMMDSLGTFCWSGPLSSFDFQQSSANTMNATRRPANYSRQGYIVLLPFKGSSHLASRAWPTSPRSSLKCSTRHACRSAVQRNVLLFPVESSSSVLACGGKKILSRHMLKESKCGCQQSRRPKFSTGYWAAVSAT